MRPYHHHEFIEPVRFKKFLVVVSMSILHLFSRYLVVSAPLSHIPCAICLGSKIFALNHAHTAAEAEIKNLDSWSHTSSLVVHRKTPRF